MPHHQPLHHHGIQYQTRKSLNCINEFYRKTWRPWSLCCQLHYGLRLTQRPLKLSCSTQSVSILALYHEINPLLGSILTLVTTAHATRYLVDPTAKKGRATRSKSDSKLEQPSTTTPKPTPESSCTKSVDHSTILIYMLAVEFLDSIRRNAFTTKAVDLARILALAEPNLAHLLKDIHLEFVDTEEAWIVFLAKLSGSHENVHKVLSKLQYSPGAAVQTPPPRAKRPFDRLSPPPTSKSKVIRLASQFENTPFQPVQRTLTLAKSTPPPTIGLQSLAELANLNNLLEP